uniref:Uncharacterized protein n=1 Tax=Rhizophora mucronata TaxID=61149 RepID=A0A2P2NG59_RHIMU
MLVWVLLSPFGRKEGEEEEGPSKLLPSKSCHFLRA